MKRPGSRFLALVAGAVVVTACMGQVLAVRASEGAGSVPSPLARYGRLRSPRSVNLLKAARVHAAPGEHPARVLPFLPAPRRPGGEFSKHVPQVHVASSALSPAPGSPLPLTAATTVAASKGVLASFPGASLNADVSALGSDQAGTPPDTQLAAGPNDLVEAVNSALWVWSKAGAVLTSADLNVFFSVPSGYSFTDPRVAYDAAAGRWFLSGLSVDSSNDSQVYVAVSETSDPTGNWYVSTLSAQSGVLQDQPKLGFDSSVVVISWNDFSGSPLTFSGQETWVINESELLTGSTFNYAYFGPDPTRAAVVPAISLTSTSTAYAAYNNSCGSNTTGSCLTGASAIGVVTLTGVPPSTVTWGETDPAITPTTIPPPADQPGSPASISTDDDRFLAATYANGTLYVSGNDSCIPAGDTVARPCARLIEVAVGTSPTVTLDEDLGYAGGDIYYPAVIPDASGNVFIAATFSSTSVYPEATGWTLPAGGSSFSGVSYESGGGVYYSSTGCSEPGFTGCRWGDYSGAAVDPSNPTDIWLASEYAPSSSNDWGTAIAELTLSPPTVSGVSPATGSTSGGTSVTVQGTNFLPGAVVDFGAAAASNVSVVSPTELTAVSPADAAAGTVNVTVTTAYGTSSVTTADQFTYGTPELNAYTSLPPTRLLDTRATGQTLGAGQSLNLTVVGGSVPTTATAVALNVTVTNTTSSSYLSVFPAGQSRPVLSNLNWRAGETVPNLVIVPIGANGQVTFYNYSGSTDVVADLEGYFSPEPAGATNGSYVPLSPGRIVDTRTGSGEPYAGDTLGPGTTLDVQVEGQGGVPSAGVSAVVVNVTVTNTTASSYLTAYPQGGTRPLASNLNWTAGDTVANRVVVPVNPSTGQISLYNYSGSTDVVVDVDGYFTTGGSAPANASLFTPISPIRVLDTRQTGPSLGPGVTRVQQMGGVDGIAANATAVVTNVTATDTTASSYFTVYPGGVRPLASDVDWLAGQTAPNLTIATLSSTEEVSVYNYSGTADLVIDAFGYFSPA